MAAQIYLVRFETRCQVKSGYLRHNQRKQVELWALTVEGTSGCGEAFGTAADGNPVLRHVADIQAGC